MPFVDAVAVVGEAQRLAVQQHLAGDLALQPAYAARDLAAAGADQPGEPEDFALAELEGDVARIAGVR